MRTTATFASTATALLLCTFSVNAALPRAADLPAAPVLDWASKVDASVLTEAATTPTEFIVYLKTQADFSGAAALKTKTEKGRYVFNRLRAAADATQGPLLAQLELMNVEHRGFWISNLIWVRGGIEAVEAMASNPEVEHIYASGYGLLQLPEAPKAATDKAGEPRAPEDNLTNIGAPAVWAMGYTGQGVVVAGADSGVAWTHPALAQHYRGLTNSDPVEGDHNFNWHVGAVPNSECPDTSVPCDDDQFFAGGHGSHTMGTMIGDDGGANQIGVAPGAQWIGCRNMNYGAGTIPSYMDCMQWLIAPTEIGDVLGTTADPDMSPDVVNNSWGCVEACPPPALEDTLDASVAAGIFYVVSAGNDGDICSTMAFPLSIYENAFSVGATDHRTDNIVAFSSRGPNVADVTPPGGGPRVGPNISAPGQSVRSSIRNGSYSSLSGTSMSGPHVAGLVALVISANPELRGHVDKIRSIIQYTAVHKTTNEGCGDDTSTSVPNNAYGWGRIDAVAAVEEAIKDTDSDGITDVFDNCSLVPNPSQCDTDGDGLGNHCDGDFNNNGVVNISDLAEMKAAFFASDGDANWNANTDMNCNGVTNFADLSMLKGYMNGPPGPGESHPIPGTLE